MIETSTVAPSAPVEGVEIDRVAEYNGQSLFNLDLESLEEKPWRKPGIFIQEKIIYCTGADTTDYFNYGFDEFTWAAYCSKQTNLRNEFNPAKVMSVYFGRKNSSNLR
jgi:pre-mRNA 3'-end-processing factor FIP1